jgi:pyrroline-5-carboxylate reductase
MRGMADTTELAVLGAGNMAEAIVRGLVASGGIKPSEIVASDVAPQRRDLFEKSLGARVAADNAQAVRGARTVLLSVKPQQMKQLLAEIAPALGEQTLIVSIAAGISSGSIERNLGAGKQWRVIRTMPNTPVLVGKGMVALSRGAHATDEDLARARRLFEASAGVVVVDESKIDAVTAVSGSGPAYFFFLVEQMIAAGVSLGLTPGEAHLLATRTAAGAAEMLVSSPESPQELRRKVTSPNGTTQAAIETMQARGVPEALVAAMRRAAERSKELGG